MARTHLQEQLGRTTRRRIVKEARRAFAARGYHGSRIAEIAERCRVTEGAVFHHFPSKRDLLREVFEEIERETVAEIEERIAVESEPRKRLEAAVETFLLIGSRQEKRQIAFRDAPSVLGWEAVRRLQSKHALPLASKLVEELHDDAHKLVAQMLLALVAEAAITIDRSEKPTATRRQLKAILIAFGASPKSPS